MQSTATGEPKPTSATDIKTIDAIDLLALYNGINARIPWPEFKTILLYFSEYSDKYSKAGASLVDGIKYNLKSAIDAHSEITYHVSRWCSSIVPHFEAHNKLSAMHSLFNAEKPNRLLQQVLNATVDRMVSTQFALRIISVHFNEILKQMPALINQFNIDFNEKSKFFQKLCKIENDETCCIVGNKLGKAKKGVVVFKEKLAQVMQLFIDFNDLIGRATPNVTKALNVLNTQLQHVADMIAKVAKARGTEIIDASVTETIILIGKCNAYVQKHK